MPCHLLLTSSKSIHDNEHLGQWWPTFVCPIWASLIGRWPCHIWAIKWWPMMNQKWERTTSMINLHIYPNININSIYQQKIEKHCFYQTFFLCYFILKSTYANTVFICFFLYYISFLYFNLKFYFVYVLLFN
jgi:hypothetical protein